MFDRLVNRDLPRRAAMRGAYSLGAIALETVFLLAMAAITAQLAARRPDRQPVVDVVFVRTAPRRAGPTPPPPPPPAAGRRGTATRRMVVSKPAPPTALIQPREVPPEMKVPGPGEPGDGLDDGGEGGVEGGVAGGVVGGVVGGVIGGSLDGYGRGDEFEEAPQYATTGFRKPAQAVPGCLRSAIRVPRELAGYVSGPITVKFAVGRDGSVGRVEVVGAELDERIVEVIRRGLRYCRWIPGADAQGRSTALWVVMPLRFEAG